MGDVVIDCTKLVFDYVWFLDHADDDVNKTASDFAQLFSEDATLELGNLKLEDETFVGHSEIAGRYLQGRTTMRFLHLMTNVRIIPVSPEAASGTGFVSFHIHPIGSSMSGEGAFTGVGEYRDRYRLTSNGWKIFSRRSIVRLHSGTGIINAPTI